jgi:DNA-binding NarL/FixJ family response regulator
LASKPSTTLRNVPGPFGTVKLLRESVDATDGSEAVLERMRSLLEYGAALHRSGKRSEAGRVLGDALDLAREGGAGAIARRASEELTIAGPRAGKAARRGRAALSPGERRVAQLAVDGLTNREIAEELFVTRKAVEWHLHNAYGKLGIHSRKELAAIFNLEA